jgi:hypothetical protein
MRITAVLFAAASMLAGAGPSLTTQKADPATGVRLVHNGKTGAWGEKARVRLELVRTFGGAEVEDPNLVIQAPYDVDRDSAGNIYILDTRASQIFKIGPDGKFIKTIGRPGQGPGEFQGAFSMDIDAQDLIHVFEAMNRRIQILDAEGRSLRTIKLTSLAIHQIRRLPGARIVKGGGLSLRDLMDPAKTIPPLIEILDFDGNAVAAFADAHDYKDVNVNGMANNFSLDVDASGGVTAAFQYQNRIERYAPDGKILWRADRELAYGTEVLDKGFINRGERGTSIQSPRMNMVSGGVAVDGKGHIWVNTWNRQMTPEEQTSRVSVGGSVSKVKQGRIARMDIHKLEIFGSDGVLLGAIPLAHLAHGIRICGDALFIWDREEAAVYQYRIIEAME